jgi:hypothetical protein
MAFGGIHPFMLKKAAAGGGGDLYSVTPCLGGAAVLCEDTMIVAPSVDDVVSYTDSSYNYYCGTVAATGQGGTAAYDLDSSGFTDCDDCADYIGGGP